MSASRRESVPTTTWTWEVVHWGTVFKCYHCVSPKVCNAWGVMWQVSSDLYIACLWQFTQFNITCSAIICRWVCSVEGSNKDNFRMKLVCACIYMCVCAQVHVCKFCVCITCVYVHAGSLMQFTTIFSVLPPASSIPVPFPPSTTAATGSWTAHPRMGQ